MHRATLSLPVSGPRCIPECPMWQYICQSRKPQKIKLPVQRKFYTFYLFLPETAQVVLGARRCGDKGRQEPRSAGDGRCLGHSHQRGVVPAWPGFASAGTGARPARVPLLSASLTRPKCFYLVR